MCAFVVFCNNVSLKLTMRCSCVCVFEFVSLFSMPASSALDSKDRIMGGGISAVARRRGSVHRLSESWDVG